MFKAGILKPSHDEWLRWSQVVTDRLSACVYIYSKPPFDDVFMPEAERQEKNGRALELMREIYARIDDAETPTDSMADVAHHDERVIAGLIVLMQKTLQLLPELSADMQKLLKSSWYDHCNGAFAEELFRGPSEVEAEGIGSGHPEHRRLPLALYNLLEREKIGEGRQPRAALHRSAPTRQRQEYQEHPVKRRWTDRVLRYPRSSGRDN